MPVVLITLDLFVKGHYFIWYLSNATSCWLTHTCMHAHTHTHRASI